MANIRLLRLSATLLFIGEVVLTYFAQYVHPGGGATDAVNFAAYAASRDWTAIHLVEFASTAVILAGLLVLFFALNITGGAPRWLGIFAAISAGLSMALAGVLYAVDGVANKQADMAWVNAPAAQQAARFASAEVIRWLEWGTASYQNILFGLALALFAAAIVWTARVPRPVGLLMGLSGVAYIALGWLVGMYGYTSANAAPTETAWLALFAITIWLLIIAWRRNAVTQPAGATESSYVD